MDRPALKLLLADIALGEVNCVVVYKVDRLTRSLLDFSRIMGVLDRHGATFVAVTQQFNTTSSLGRLTLNILLSFAQFEREMIWVWLLWNDAPGGGIEAFLILVDVELPVL